MGWTCSAQWDEPAGITGLAGAGAERAVAARGRRLAARAAGLAAFETVVILSPVLVV
jgi:hypothetical protein